jgi:uncharacterized membrane protein YeaQ/YmgE (transglycosylase-associated protein family)
VLGEIIGAIILGIIAGYLARALVPGKQDIGFLMTVLLGIGGAIVGYFLFTELLGIGDDDKFDLGGLIGAVIGSIILLLIYIKFVHPSNAAGPPAVEAGDREDRQRDRDRERADRGGGGGRGGRRDREPR